MTQPVKTYTYRQKWGEEDPFVTKGHAQIPALLFIYGARLLLEPDEAYLVCHILRFKFTPSDEGPSEKKLAELIGKSDDTIRKLLHRLVKKGFLRIERARGDFGYYTSTTYNFSGLRAYLNECHYQDHPQDRPKGKKPLPMPQKSQATPQPRGVVRQRQAERETAPADAAEQGVGSPQSCGTLKSPLELEEKEEDFSLVLFPEQKEPDKIGPNQAERNKAALRNAIDPNGAFGRAKALRDAARKSGKPNA